MDAQTNGMELKTHKPMFIQQLIFDKAIKNKAESIVLSINGAWKIGYLH